MSTLRAAFARIAGFFGLHRSEADLDDELRSHLEMETAENIRRGMAPDEARRQALLASGGVAQAAEAVRDRRSVPWLEDLVADLRYAARTLRRAPAFTAVVIVTLALGIGANTAIFSVIRGVLLKPLPHKDGDRLMYLRQSADGPGADNINFSVPEVRELRDGVRAFSGLAEYSQWFGTLQEDNNATRIETGLITGNYFEVMGLSAAFGRLTQPTDDGAAAAPVMVLAHEFWIRHFGADSSIVGKRLTVDGHPVTVIGVLQPAPYFPGRMDALMNMVNSPHHLSAFMIQNRAHRMTEIVARLAPGATVEQARAQVGAIRVRVQAENPTFYDPGSHYRVAVIPFKQVMGEKAQLTLWLLMASAGFVLIIASANVVNLTLMRGVRREGEVVVRAALGAGVARLRRLLLVENLLLSLVGAALGMVVAVFGLKLLTALAARYSPRAAEIRLDSVVLMFTLGISIGIALLLSFLASLPKEGGVGAAIAAGGRRMSSGFGRNRLQRGLVVAQIAVSVILLALAGLLTRTMIALSDVPTGLVTEEVLTMPVSLLTGTQLSGSTPQQLMALDANAKASYEVMRSEIRSLPGVVEVGLGSTMPLQNSQIHLEVKAEGKALAPGQPTPTAEYRTASPEFFRAAGIPMLEGHGFTLADNMTAPQVVVINKTLANRLFPGEDPVGKRLAWTGEVLKFTGLGGDWRTIVGVVGDTHDGGLDAAPSGAVYQPFAQQPVFFGGIVVRADSNVAAIASAATRIVKRLAPTTPVENVLTVAQIKDQSVAPRRLNAELISSFGLLAVLIAAVGIAGVLAFSVSARTGEIGIRMSLGADSARVLMMILREGGVLLLVGLIIGVGGAWLGSGLMSGLLFGIAPHDPMTFAGVALAMGFIGIVACLIPARRAAMIDPAIAMRAS